MRDPNDKAVASTVAHASFKKDTISGINQAYNGFLGLGDGDKILLRKYHHVLASGSDDFAGVFYKYLSSSPSTEKILATFRSSGGSIESLVKKQIQHLFGLLSGDFDDASAMELSRVASIHRAHNIEPVWIMGAYKLYLEHLQQCIRECDGIDAEDREPLEASVIKYLFRDMGLMLEEYWDSSLLMLAREKENVTKLRDQMTSMLANIPQLLWSIDVLEEKPIYVSQNARKICGKEISLPIPCLEWTIEDDKEVVEEGWRKALSGEVVEVESRVTSPSGEKRWFRRKFCPFWSDDGKVIRIDGLMEDITEAKSAYDRLNQMATTDSLTGLANRSKFHDQLVREIAVSASLPGGRAQLAIMLMDLNHFKELNDTLGHPVGDRVLIEVGARLRSVVEDGDSLARLGGDEFAVLVSKRKDVRPAVERIAAKIQRVFNRPFRVEENDYFLGVSIGIAVFPDDGIDVSTLLSRADVAMYCSKRMAQPFNFYHPEINPGAQRNLQLSADLYYALARNELVLHYQPKIDFRTGVVVGAEALLRWRHPRLGVVAPDEFIFLAERTGRIHAITRWVVETAIRQSKAWRESGLNISIAVNVSARSFQNSRKGLVEEISALLKLLEVPSSCLELEITESLLMTDIGNISETLKLISALGVRIAIDDFGTGYSSLAYLKSLPVSAIKIDKSFVMNMVEDENDAVIVQSTIGLAHNLGFAVVAEGIENGETLAMLRRLGCDGGQGYFFSEPVLPENFFLSLAEINKKALV